MTDKEWAAARPLLQDVAGPMAELDRIVGGLQ
jgi:hypothetical protein